MDWLSKLNVVNQMCIAKAQFKHHDLAQICSKISELVTREKTFWDRIPCWGGVRVWCFWLLRRRGRCSWGSWNYWIMACKHNKNYFKVYSKYFWFDFNLIYSASFFSYAPCFSQCKITAHKKFGFWNKNKCWNVKTVEFEAEFRLPKKGNLNNFLREGKK